MWIRSQDKKILQNIDALSIDQQINTFNYYIIGYLKGDPYFKLGIYTKERALEVLDEVQRDICLVHTKDLYMDENPDGVYDYSLVFEMPEE